jgi:FtsZ-binding cell division protein ZapB
VTNAPLPADASRAEKLERIVDQAVDTISEILSVPIDPYMPDGNKFMSVKKDAAIAALNLAVKVDENHFRKRSQSALVAILEKITAEERAQPLTLIQAAE